VETQAVPGTPHLSDQVPDLFDSLNLFFEIFSLDEVGELGVILGISGLVHEEQGLVNGLLQLQGGLDGLQSSPPLVRRRLEYLPEDYPSSAHVLVVDQLLGMLSLLMACLTEPLSKAKKSDVVPTEVGGEGQVDV